MLGQLCWTPGKSKSSLIFFVYHSLMVVPLCLSVLWKSIFFVCVFCFSLRMCYICVELWKGSRVSRRAVKSRQMVAVVLPLGNVDKRCQSVVAFRLQVLTHWSWTTKDPWQVWARSLLSPPSVGQYLPVLTRSSFEWRRSIAENDGNSAGKGTRDLTTSAKSKKRRWRWRKDHWNLGIGIKSFGDFCLMFLMLYHFEVQKRYSNLSFFVALTFWLAG